MLLSFIFGDTINVFGTECVMYQNENSHLLFIMWCRIQTRLLRNILWFTLDVSFDSALLLGNDSNYMILMLKLPQCLL